MPRTEAPGGPGQPTADPDQEPVYRCCGSTQSAVLGPAGLVNGHPGFGWPLRSWQYAFKALLDHKALVRQGTCQGTRHTASTP